MAKRIFRSKFHIAYHGFWNMMNPSFRYIVYQSLGAGKKTRVDQSYEFLEECIHKAVGWILFQQGMQPDGGVTSWVQFLKGKTRIGTSYPEVTGYIIPTLFDYASRFQRSDVFACAVKAADFELAMQDPSGFFPGHVVGQLTGPSVFNSAQIIHGLVRAFKETGDKRYFRSAVNAATWICSAQEEDGSWGKLNFLGIKRVYDTKVCQALLELGRVAGDEAFSSVVDRNLDFVLRNQKANGWFYNCDNSSEKNDAPLTHTIGYTTEGLTKCYLLTKREELLLAARNALDALLHRFELRKALPAGRFDSNWRPAVTSSCITGSAQVSIGWMDLYEITRDLGYLNAALKMNDLLKKIQLSSPDSAIDGALPSSYPFWGDYFPFNINSWGVKYFIDAMIQEHRLKGQVEESVH